MAKLISKTYGEALFELAVEENKVDVFAEEISVILDIETFLLSLFFEGRLSTFAPISYMDRSKVSMIRPMIYISENDVACYARNLPVVHNPCPADKHTKREYMKDLIKSLQKDIPFVKDRMLGAISNPDRYNLWDNVIEKYNSERNKNKQEENNQPEQN